MEWLFGLDHRLFLIINGWGEALPWLDGPMWFITGRWAAIPLYAFLAFLLWKYLGRRGFIIAVLGVILLVVLTDQGSVHLFKNTFERLRPCHHPGLMEQVRLVQPSCGGLYGFVSSHAANTFGLTAYLITLLYRHNRAILLLLVWASVVGISRIYLGAHFPSDVAVGAAFGAGLGLLLGAGVLRVTRS
jgi:undecaprenyl-diphosphatase